MGSRSGTLRVNETLQRELGFLEAGEAFFGSRGHIEKFNACASLGRYTRDWRNSMLDHMTR